MTTNAKWPETSGGIESYVWRVTGVAVLSSVMSLLDTLGRDLHSPIARTQWVLTGYLLALAVVIPASGWMARRFGARRVYLGAPRRHGLRRVTSGLKLTHRGIKLTHPPTRLVCGIAKTTKESSIAEGKVINELIGTEGRRP